MKVLATTSHSVLAIDCITGDARIVHRGAGLYYGIARIGSRYAVAARRRLVSSALPQEDERGCVLLFDADLAHWRPVEAPFSLRDLHQIAWFDDRLFATCSFDDSVAIWDGAEWERWTPQLPPGDEAQHPRREVQNDRYHYNSFHVTADEVALLAHNHGPSDIHFFDRRSRAYHRTLPLGRQAHDIWCDEGHVWTCSSIEGKLVADDGCEVVIGGFPRGVTFHAGARVVGISALSERGERDWASAALALCDAAWQPRHYVRLAREGMILDVTALSDAHWNAIHHASLEHCRLELQCELNAANLAGDHASSPQPSR